MFKWTIYDALQKSIRYAKYHTYDGCLREYIKYIRSIMYFKWFIL